MRLETVSYKHLSEEERARKIAEMQESATQVQQKLEQQYQRDVAGEETRQDNSKAESKSKSKNPTFIKCAAGLTMYRNMRENVYAKGEITIEEKLKRNTHYNQPMRLLKDETEQD